MNIEMVGVYPHVISSDRGVALLSVRGSVMALSEEEVVALRLRETLADFTRAMGRLMTTDQLLRASGLNLSQDQRISVQRLFD
jgi:redox-regulated HSP33 family molecular chaperone